MAHSYSVAQIEQFKREAKKLCVSPLLTHTQALDHIASKHGFSNWSLLMKHSEAHGMAEPDRITRYRFIRTADEMRQALRVIQLKPYPIRSAAEEAKACTEDICDKFISARNAINFSIEYMQCLLTVPRFKVRSTSRVYWEMHRWLPYALISASDDRDPGLRLLVNRKYKPVGHLGDQWVNYADFPHLVTSLSQEQLTHITRPGSSEGYLFRDGSSPWHSRAEAKTYLEHLLLMQTML